MIGSMVSFAAGFLSGWAARSTVGSTREALVKLSALAFSVRGEVSRAVAEQVEWVEDTLAEGRARYEAALRAAQGAAEEHASADREKPRRNEAA